MFKNISDVLLILLVLIIFIRLFYVENYCNIDTTKNYITVDQLESIGIYENRRDELIDEVRNSYHDMCYECLSMAEDTEACDSAPHCSSELPSVRGANPSFNLGEGITPFVCSEAALTEDEVHAEHRKNYRDGYHDGGGLVAYGDCVNTVPTENGDQTGFNNCINCMQTYNLNQISGHTRATTEQMEDFCNMNEVIRTDRHISTGLYDDKSQDKECIGDHC